MSEKWLEARSKENAVFNFQDELRYIDQHNKIMGLTHSQVKTLIRYGVIFKDGSHGLCKICLTDYTKAVLRDLEGQKMTAKNTRKGTEYTQYGCIVPGSEMSLIELKEDEE